MYDISKETYTTQEVSTLSDVSRDLHKIRAWWRAGSFLGLDILRRVENSIKRHSVSSGVGELVDWAYTNFSKLLARLDELLGEYYIPYSYGGSRKLHKVALKLMDQKEKCEQLSLKEEDFNKLSVPEWTKLIYDFYLILGQLSYIKGKMSIHNSQSDTIQMLNESIEKLLGYSCILRYIRIKIKQSGIDK